jgi:hypothetical protein
MKEQELFDYLKRAYYPDLEKSEGTFDTFDCVSREFEMYVELKSRLTHYPTLLLERKKYNALMQHAENLSYQAWYINNTPEGIYGFNLSHMAEPVWETKWLPKTTEFGDRGKIDKEVTFLDVNTATIQVSFPQTLV